MSIADQVTQLKTDFDQVYEAGKQAEWSEFWDLLQMPFGSQPNVRTYQFYFWPLEAFKPKNNLVCTTNASCAFAYITGALGGWMFDFAQILEDCGVTLDTSKCVNAMGMFQNTTTTRLPKLDLSKANVTGYMFSNCVILRTIEEIVCTSATIFYATTFSSCSSLENVTFTGTIATNGLSVGPCTRLTHDSLMSILSCLCDYSADTSGTAWKITIGGTNIAKLTADELLIAENKGWTVV